MLDLLALACRRSPRAHALILTEEDPAPAVAGLESRGVPPDRRTVRGVPWREVPRWFSLATAGVMLIESAPSKRASAPTKLGEFLASGVPVVITPGIGDSEALVGRARVGVVVRRPGVAGRDPEGLVAALDELDALRKEGAGLAERCRATAERHLSLRAAVDSYASLYGEIIGPSCA
jgi:glycosyltransferase involved in cell wall biosynthesis